MEPSASPTLVGTTIGNYRVMSKLGEGGMGDVYLAEHPLIGKKVALKVLHAEHCANRDIVDRFFTEAKAVNDIGHPNIVDIIDFGQIESPSALPIVYFIMEFLQGEALSALLSREAPLEPGRCVHICGQVVEALAASHAKGIVHRDLKPDNIFLLQRSSQPDLVKLLDFGIAKLTGDRSGSARTRTGVVMGTPAYMSPEQCEGTSKVDHRSDIYSLGIMLYEMLTGRVPFVGEGYGAILVQHLTRDPDPPSAYRPGIPPALEAIVMRMLAKPREQRFQSMDEVAAALRGSLGTAASMPVATNPTMTPAPGLPAPMTAAGPAGAAPRSWARLVVGLIIALCLALGVVAFLVRGRGQGNVPAPRTDSQARNVASAAPAQPQASGSAAAALPDAAPQAVATDAAAAAQVAAEVKIAVTSTPSGADVRISGEATPRGKTPVELILPRAATETELILKAPGYKEKRKRIKAQHDTDVDVTLEKESSGSRPSRLPKPPRGGDLMTPSF